jgi:hypothetical protein
MLSFHASLTTPNGKGQKTMKNVLSICITFLKGLNEHPSLDVSKGIKRHSFPGSGLIKY